MSDTIYYTFSTIPQVLAAFAALVGVFAIFKFQLIEKSLDGIAQNFFELAKESYLVSKEDVENLKKAKIARIQTNIIHWMNQIIHSVDSMNQYPNNSNQKEIDKTLDNFNQKILQYKTEILNKRNLKAITKKTLLFSVFVIFLSICILPFASSISNCLSSWLFATILVLTGINLFLLVKIIWDSL